VGGLALGWTKRPGGRQQGVRSVQRVRQMQQEAEQAGRPAGSNSAGLVGLTATALGGLCAVQGAAASGLVALPGPLLEASARLSEAGLLAGPLGLCALTLIGVQRCLSATARSQRRTPHGRAQHEQVLLRLDAQAEQVQHLHVSTLGLERGLLEHINQAQTLTDHRLDAQRQAVERLESALAGVEERLAAPRAGELALQAELAQLQQRLQELTEKTNAGLASLEQNLCDELVQASDTISRWLSRDEVDLSASLEQGSVTRYEHATHAESSDRSLELEQALAALPKALGRLEIPDDYELRELPDGADGTQREQSPRTHLKQPSSERLGEDSWLDDVEEEHLPSVKQTSTSRPGFNSAPLIAPSEAAALAQTGFHRVQSLGFLDGMVEPSHPELAGVPPETPPVYDLEGPGAALPIRAQRTSRQAHPQS
jgi:hypothetical protein